MSDWYDDAPMFKTIESEVLAMAAQVGMSVQDAMDRGLIEDKKNEHS